MPTVKTVNPRKGYAMFALSTTRRRFATATAVVASLAAVGLLSAPSAQANPHLAPNPGDFAPGSMECSKTSNSMTFSMDWMGKAPSMFRVYQTDKVTLDLAAAPVQDNRVQFAYGNERAGWEIVVPQWNGDPNQVKTISVTIAEIQPDQPYSVVGAYMPPEGYEGMVPANALFSGAITWDTCSQLD